MTAPHAAPEPAWVLREVVASKRLGKPIYFQKMTFIGPRTTADLSEAARFSTEQRAMLSPATWHALSFFEPELIPATGGRDDKA